ncbi:unnamed protein product [Euphydryas editha]|uniref:carbonyl reductase (NADPH) n=1 Tax=Euphydryas editha TaxID=104508 RepID=A0AAU9TLV4_EUPED|nr:unnamed protein product [Euphydryas editha]
MADKVAVVTGSNKGLGFGIVKELCKRGVGSVYLTARDSQRGLQAVEKIKQEGLCPEFHQLDVSDRRSVKKFAEYLKQKHNGLDILINNAAITTEHPYKITYEEAKRVIEINYKSYFNIQDYLFPILNKNARVINVSSSFGHLANLKNTYWIERLTKLDIKTEDVDAFVDWFLTSVKNETLKKENFGTETFLAYRVSKIAACALTRVQNRNIDRNIAINSLHPGFIKTDMTRDSGELTVEEASKTPVYLALDADQSLKGKYIWYDKTEMDWEDLNADLDCYNKEEFKKFMGRYMSSD